MRLNVGFVDPIIVSKIKKGSHIENISKSKYVEKIISNYFDEVNEGEIDSFYGRYSKVSHRLNLTFQNRALLVSVNKYALKYQLSKSRLIESILKKYFSINIVHNNLHEELKSYFDSKILKYIIKDKLKKYDSASKSETENEVQEENKEIDLFHMIYKIRTSDIIINANKIYLNELNKIYLKQLEESMIFDIALINSSENYQGFFYITLVRNAQLIYKRPIYQSIKNNDDDSNKKTELIPTKNKFKYIYHIKVESIILKLGKVSTEENNGKQKIIFTPFDKKWVLKRASKYIDFGSIEFIAKDKQNRYNNNPDYYPFLSNLIKSDGGYYIRTTNRPKSINRLLKKKIFHKVDSSYFEKRGVTCNALNSSKDKLSIIYFFPITTYSKSKEYIKFTEKEVKEVKEKDTKDTEKKQHEIAHFFLEKEIPK